jgi:nucleoside-diphosphate-sugar epimerase
MKILITGSTGYIGHQLASRLIANGKHLNLLVRNFDSPYLLRNNNISLFNGDITEPSSISHAMRDCSQVYHCAAIARLGIKDSKKFFDVNVSGTKNILEAAVNAGVHRLVFTSSAGVFGPSCDWSLTEKDTCQSSFESDYDLSKHLAENHVKDYVRKGLHAIIVNPSRVFGPGPATYSNGVTRMIGQLMNKKLIAFPNLDNYCVNYSFIDDVVDGHIMAMEKGTPGESYILGGENITYSKFQSLFTKNSDSKNHILRIPLFMFKILAHMMEILDSNTEFSPSLVKRLAKNHMLSSEKAVTNLGYKITPFEKSLKKTIEYLNAGRRQH